MPQVSAPHPAIADEFYHILFRMGNLQISDGNPGRWSGGDAWGRRALLRAAADSGSKL